MVNEVTLTQCTDALVEVNRNQELDSLKRARSSVKGKITRLTHWVQGIENPDDACPEEVKIRLATLTQAYEEFDKIQGQIERISSDTSDADTQRIQVEDNYFSVKATYNRLLNILTSAPDVPLISPPRSENENTGNQNITPTLPTNFLDVRLPPITLPTFEGNTANFESFSELFKSLVDSNPQLTDVAKFYYLRNSLKGQASQVLANIPSTSQNYQLAWGLLTDRYSCVGHTVTRLNNELLSLPVLTSDSHVALRKLMDESLRIVRSLKALHAYAEDRDNLYVAVICNKLSEDTRKKFLLQLESADVIPKYDDLYTFIDKRLKVMESMAPTKKEGKVWHHKTNTMHINANQEKARYDSASNNNKPRVNNPQSNRQFFFNNRENKTAANTNLLRGRPFNRTNKERTFDFSCDFCSHKTHRLGQCDSFKNLPIQERKNYVLSHGHCLNCLSKNHQVAACDSRYRCSRCALKHHSVLHADNTDQPSTSNSNTQDSQNAPAISLLNSNSNTALPLLSTASILIADASGAPRQVTALVDSGSQSGFITEKLATALQLPPVSSFLRISGVGSSKNISKNRVFAQIRSNTSNYQENVELFVLPQICMKLPPVNIDISNWTIPENIKLADDTFYIPKNIDILLGVNTFFKILYKGRLPATPTRPALLHTRLGWLLGGEVPNAPPSRHCHSYLSLSENVERLCRLDECLPAPKHTPEEIECEQHFLRTHSRAPCGRFIVRLPFKQMPTNLGFSRCMPRRRWLAVENRLARDSHLSKEYNDFMQHYKDMGHMDLVGPETFISELKSQYYLPHHPVIKHDSTTTPVRIVFDASAPTSNGLSLNDLLMAGPKTQSELFDILLRFRLHKYVYTADVAKMFRQILLADEDRKHQLILWRADPTQPLEVYRLNTVTYGMTSSPYLAIRCLQQLAEYEKDNYNTASKAIRDFYVDDFISGHDDLQQALTLQKEMIDMLASAGFPLRKWSANHAELLKNIPSTDRETSQTLDIFSSDVIKALGLFWQPILDIFTYDVSKILRTPANTKRQVLSQLASLYDPLGIVGPIVCYAKIFVQNLWNLKLDWDQPIPSDLAEQWASFNNSLQLLRQLHIPRHVAGEPTIISYQLHGFCDASTKAYGSAVYLRTINDANEITVNLLCAKSRVAPQKQLTLPRLELCAALLLVRLLRLVVTALDIAPMQVFCWTDSQIVLSWIGSPSYVWKTFVANRVAEIQNFNTTWHYVKSELNPADLISRGCTVTQLRDSNLWWGGPTFLLTDNHPWIEHIVDTPLTDLPEQKGKKLFSATSTSNELDLFTRYSSIKTLINVTAYISRFNYNSRPNALRIYGSLSVAERDAALTRLIIIAQQETFSEELHTLSTKGHASKKSKLRQLSPFVDDNGILRVGGRLKNTSLIYSRKHPIILFPNHPLTRLLIRQAHFRTLHGGPQLVLSTLQRRYWIVNGKNVVRNYIHKCIQCFRAKPVNLVPPMGELPSVRTEALRPFYHTGVDFAGPFLLKPPTRSNIKLKYYVAIFICMSTRAIHLELVGSLTAENFIATLTRFLSRRGLCRSISSDNGKTFVGARNIIKEVTKFLRDNSEAIAHHLATTDIEWKFIPPLAPHFGGLWEAAVKSMKHHLKRVAGLALLNYEEFSTLLCSIEACLNSRPITAMSTDPSDLEALTPGHFLIGTALLTPPSIDTTDQPISRLTRWHRIQSMTQHFWKRWSTEYLTSLQPRARWTIDSPAFTTGQLVLIKEDNLPPLHWRLGRVAELHPGPDSIVRVLTVKTASGIMKRSAHKLFPLPVAEQ